MRRASVENSTRKSGVKTPRLRNVLELCLEATDYKDYTVHLSVVSDLEIRELNREWRNKDKPTDVLSFSQLERVDEELSFAEVFPGPKPLGDIVISFETASCQAQQIGHSLDDEYLRLIVHGFLHLLGHDHVHGGRQAAKMKREEDRLLSYIGAHLDA